MADFSLTDAERRTLLETARRSIAARFEGTRLPVPEATPALGTPCGAFVTLKIQGRLRGCIGHITAAAPLIETVRDVALSSAFDDPRFPPLSHDELEQVTIEVSVLSPFRLTRDPAEIRVGTHGILVRRAGRSGLLLPQVATEQGWEREEFLAHTCRKAGLPDDAWREPDTAIEIFSAIVFGEKE
ncbi:MAG: AmmeMemoRadiSam system protein A [Spirochaetes bacterium]|nr:AmmeMemoRadiSam system protein A [Spirochaetota bacterium]